MSGSHGVLPGGLAEGARGGMAPLARRLAQLGVTANSITFLGFGLSVVGAGFVAAGQPVTALAVLLVGSLCDTLDGALARATGGGTKLGAFLDSTFDRLSDGAFFGAAAALGAVTADPLLFWAALVALVASFQVSYVRAKAEQAGLNATVGPAPREARLVILLIGLGGWALLGSTMPFVVAVVATAILATITLVQRVVLVTRALSAQERK